LLFSKNGQPTKRDERAYPQGFEEQQSRRAVFGETFRAEA
jgi:hypothetical protein